MSSLAEALTLKVALSAYKHNYSVSGIPLRYVAEKQKVLLWYSESSDSYVGAVVDVTGMGMCRLWRGRVVAARCDPMSHSSNPHTHTQTSLCLSVYLPYKAVVRITNMLVVVHVFRQNNKTSLFIYLTSGIPSSGGDPLLLDLCLPTRVMARNSPLGCPDETHSDIWKYWRYPLFLYLKP